METKYNIKHGYRYEYVNTNREANVNVREVN